MTDILSLIRPDLKGFGGYVSAAKEATGAPPAIKLDANESPWPPFGPISSLCDTHQYAAPQPPALIARMGAIWNVDPGRIYATCGSDQAIDMLIRFFCRPGVDTILVCPPTFGMYEIYGHVAGAKTLYVPRKDDGQLDVNAILKTATDETKLLFLPTPAAPTGEPIAKADILTLCEARAGKSVIVADEAYVEFSDDPQGFVPYLEKIPNLVVMRTLSKAHALAGERVGCLIGPHSLVRAIGIVGPAYPLAQSAVRAALDALSPAGLAQSAARRKIIVEERQRLAEKLLEAEGVVRIRPSQTNFLFIETTDASAFLARLRSFDIAARDMSGQRPNAVRLAVGSPEQNNLVLEALGLDVDKPAKTARLFGVQRKTNETDIAVTVDLDAPAFLDVKTGLGFFDHMLDQLASHGGFGLVLRARGDLNVDAHHTIEDCALALGEAMRGALGDKKGIARFGFTAPMDEALAHAVIDLSGRPYLEMHGTWPGVQGDGMSPDLAKHFLRSFAQTLGATLHIDVKGENTHHMIEAMFKALGRALRQAIAREGEGLPSTKGTL